MDQQDKLAQLERLRAEVARLETELAPSFPGPAWPPQTYYMTYHILAGMVLGLISAGSSLLLNVVGAAMFKDHPLELIRVYLTFPMGQSALSVESGFVLAAGVCLYLGTGMIGGIPFHLILSRFFDEAPFAKRFVVATIMGLGVWIINFYGVLYWLQPALLDGRWIVNMIPIPVAALTHVVFGWTMLLVDQWGRFVPYRSVSSQEPHP